MKKAFLLLAAALVVFGASHVSFAANEPAADDTVTEAPVIDEAGDEIIEGEEVSETDEIADEAKEAADEAAAEADEAADEAKEAADEAADEAEENNTEE